MKKTIGEYDMNTLSSNHNYIGTISDFKSNYTKRYYRDIYLLYTTEFCHPMLYTKPIQLSWCNIYA